MTGVDLGVDLVVDVANVMGSRPDGWWRDRAGAAHRLVAGLAELPGRRVPAPSAADAPDDDSSLLVQRVVAVVEGQARAIPEVPGVVLVRAARDGDTAVVEACGRVLDDGRRPLAVTADRGLRQRLPSSVLVGGPGWLRRLLD
jgi:hypothetical protein